MAWSIFKIAFYCPESLYGLTTMYMLALRTTSSVYNGTAGSHHSDGWWKAVATTGRISCRFTLPPFMNKITTYPQDNTGLSFKTQLEWYLPILSHSIAFLGMGVKSSKPLYLMFKYSEYVRLLSLNRRAFALCAEVSGSVFSISNLKKGRGQDLGLSGVKMPA